MIEVALAVISLPALLLAVLVFGFAPGALLRLIVLAYPNGDPRRAELVAEVYVVRIWERPFWVAQQLEVAISEGLVTRLTAHRKPSPAIVATSNQAGQIALMILVVVLLAVLVVRYQAGNASAAPPALT
jgi:hypothetical protein